MELKAALNVKGTEVNQKPQRPQQGFHTSLENSLSQVFFISSSLYITYDTFRCEIISVKVPNRKFNCQILF